ncbi:nicotinamide N-methyltransferase-like [Eublepharis macularius]|uniref:Nicotinamide N-methyltransferase-like n=1 Tax=Eublepharis macularius TaxID=481883 RepID=A0AA97LEY1_EUBMA|nr:nicotinamide N-methyltransferase-like [Eublepharis macularius]
MTDKMTVKIPSTIMTAAFTEKDFYVQHFDPKEYLEMYFTFHPEKEEINALIDFILKNLHKAFHSGGIKGDTLIHFGIGSAIYPFLSACESFREIISTDYTDQNLEELQRWLRKEPGAFDWSPIVKYVCELEGDREKWVQKEETVRKAIKRVLQCDLTQPNPLAPLSLPPADCLLSTFLLGVACKDLLTYHFALKNLSFLVKPGGHLVLFALLEESFYMVGQHRFSFLYLNQKSVEEAVKEAGFDIEWVEGTKLNFPSALSDVKRECVLVARKR